MKCEYCDSYLSTVPASGVCPNCGGVLSNEQTAFLKPPVGRYKIPFAKKYMELSDTGVHFFDKPLFEKRTEICIPYEEIDDVFFEHAEKYKMGYISVRDMQNRRMPMPINNRAAYDDMTSIVFSTIEDPMFYRAYAFLKQWADKKRAKERSCNEM